MSNLTPNQDFCPKAPAGTKTHSFYDYSYWDGAGTIRCAWCGWIRKKSNENK